jgi:uncharacterized protein involved in propanediol utilization
MPRTRYETSQEALRASAELAATEVASAHAYAQRRAQELAEGKAVEAEPDDPAIFPWKEWR